MDIKVGDIIDGKRVTKVYELCGGMAYNTEPVNTVKDAVVESVTEPVKKRGGRRKKEQ